MPPALPYLKETPSQTAGPYLHIGLAPAAAGLAIFDGGLGQSPIAPETPGQRIHIEGMVIDGTGHPVKDALIEVWQADAAGIHPHPADPRHADCAAGFTGWARVVPDFDTGLWQLDTIKPGPVLGNDGQKNAPHLSLWIVARGINIGLHTRLYFDDEQNDADPLLSLIEHSRRRQTLLARRIATGHYRFDIRLQGDDETVFLDI